MLKMLTVLSMLILTLTACSGGNATLDSAAVPTARSSQPSPSPTRQAPAAPSATPTQAAPEPSPDPSATASPLAATAEPAPGASQTPAAMATQAGEQPADCTNIAAFVSDVTIADGQVFRAGDPFKKTWKVSNSGSCPWGAGYALVFAGGELMGGALSNPLPPVEPGAVAEVSVDLVAPNQPGPAVGYWQFQDAQKRSFGTGYSGSGLLWVQIAVSSFASAGSTTSIQSSQPTSVSACNATRDSSVENQLLALINQARTTQGLAPLSLRDELGAAALLHSTDMACNGFISHHGSDGSDWYARVASQGYANAASARENIYVGDPAFGGTAQGAFDWWMNSQIHRENILNPDVSEIGIAYVHNPVSEYKGYYTMVVARPWD